MAKRILNHFLLILLVIGSSGYAEGQTSMPNPYQKAVDEAEAKAKIAKAQKEEMDAKYPAPDASSLKGTSKVEGAPIESKIQAYRSLGITLDKGAADMYRLGVRKLYVYRDDDYAKVIAYRKIMQQLSLLTDEYRQCFNERTETDGVAPGLLAGIVLKWLPLLKTDVTISSSDVDVDQDAFYSELATALRRHSIQFGNPYVSSIEFVEFKSLQQSEVIKKLRSVEYYRTNTATCTGDGYTRPNLKPKLDALVVKLEEDMGLLPREGKPEKKVSKKTTTDRPPVVTIEETTETTVAQTPSSATMGLWDYVKVEKLISGMENDNAYWIKLKPVKAGGNVQVKSSPLVDIFRGGASVKFSGGAIVSFTILDNKGMVWGSGVLSGYEPYQSSGAIFRQ